MSKKILTCSLIQSDGACPPSDSPAALPVKHCSIVLHQSACSGYCRSSTIGRCAALNFEEVETIVTVSRSKSFNEAAYLLNYAPSTISKAVSSVEQEIGYTLFVRGNRANAASLTPEGKALMPDFIRIHESMQQLKNDLSAMQEDNKDRCCICFTPEAPAASSSTPRMARRT